jgi:hypothetical protein
MKCGMNRMKCGALLLPRCTLHDYNAAAAACPNSIRNLSGMKCCSFAAAAGSVRLHVALLPCCSCCLP